MNVDGENGPPGGPEATMLVEGVTCSVLEVVAVVGFEVVAVVGLKTHAAPAFELSPGPPTMRVLSPSATDTPCWAFPTAPVPTSLLPC